MLAYCERHSRLCGAGFYVDNFAKKKRCPMEFRGVVALLNCTWLFLNLSFSDVLSLVSVILAIGSYILYMWRPSLEIFAEKEKSKSKLAIKVINKAWWRKVHEVTCEVVSAQSDDFDFVRTLALSKSTTLTILPRGGYYRFKTSLKSPKRQTSQKAEHNNFRIRVSCVNGIGIRKHFEKRYLLKNGLLVEQKPSKALK